MPIALDRIMRLPAGAELRFGWKIKSEWLDAANQRDSGIPGWLPELEGAVVTVDEVRADGCMLRLCSEHVCAKARLFQDADGSYSCELHATRHAGVKSDGEWSWRQDSMKGMLGGKDDAYLAVRGGSGITPFLRLKYTDSIVELFALPAAFAHRLPRMVRAIAPGEVKVGELAPPGFADTRPARHSPCGCHAL